MATCSVCNCDDLTNYGLWPINKQLALKMVRDWEHFSLPRVLEIMGKGPLAITMSEVLSYLEVAPCF